MDPISLGLGIAGLGMQIFGGLGASSKAHEISDVQIGISRDEQQINAQKQQAMELSARRQQLEVMRNSQKAQAQATAAATNQGALFGSGLQGGLAQISGDTGTSELGINQNLEIGRNIFGINQDISNKKMQLSKLGGQEATDQGISSLGGSLIKAGPIIGQFSQQTGAWGKQAGLGMGYGGPYL